jgi:transcriptional regulator of acetoin/glycerol metabolism
MVVCTGDTIQKEHLPVQSQTITETDGMKLQDIERRHIEKVLGETGWNISRSATILGIDRATLYNKIEKFGLKSLQA